MGVPLGTSFDVAEASPVDSRMTWTGTIANLNNILNKYVGLTVFATTDSNLYVFQGNNVWEKIVTNNIDYVEVSSNGGTFNINQTHNGNVIYVNSPIEIIGTVVGDLSNYPIGYNVTIVQEGLGNVNLTAQSPLQIFNRGNFVKTAGRYAIASIIRFKNSGVFIVYGDLI